MRRIDNPRHPDFDKAWEQYKNLIYKTAMRAADRYGGSKYDYLGSAVIIFNSLLFTHKPEISDFKNYYSKYALSQLRVKFIKRDNERQAIYWYNDRYKYRKTRLRAQLRIRDSPRRHTPTRPR